MPEYRFNKSNATSKKESILKDEATRSEGDYPEEGATRALMRYRRERHGVRGRGRGQTCNRDNMRPGEGPGEGGRGFEIEQTSRDPESRGLSHA